MDKSKRKRLRAAGWKTGTAAQFLGTDGGVVGRFLCRVGLHDWKTVAIGGTKMRICDRCYKN